MKAFAIYTENEHLLLTILNHSYLDVVMKDRYRFTSKDTWYTFVDEKHRWVRNKEGLKLRMVLSNEVCSRFMERSMYWSNESIKNSNDSELRDKYSERSKKLLANSVKLKTAGYKDSVMKECKSLFTDECIKLQLGYIFKCMHLFLFQRYIIQDQEIKCPSIQQPFLINLKLLISILVNKELNILNI